MSTQPATVVPLHSPSERANAERRRQWAEVMDLVDEMNAAFDAMGWHLTEIANEVAKDPETAHAALANVGYSDPVLRFMQAMVRLRRAQADLDFTGWDLDGSPILRDK